MNIKSGNGYPSSALSNFAPHRFILDDVEFYSLEAALQSTKFKSWDMVVGKISKLVGFAAKSAGKGKNWQETQTLWWKGEPIKRDSTDYQDLLDRMYLAVAKNEAFRKALLATGDAVLTHSIGRRKQNETILTRTEFCSRLLWIRGMLKRGEI